MRLAARRCAITHRHRAAQRCFHRWRWLTVVGQGSGTAPGRGGETKVPAAFGVPVPEDFGGRVPPAVAALFAAMEGAAKEEAGEGTHPAPDADTDAEVNKENDAESVFSAGTGGTGGTAGTAGGGGGGGGGGLADVLRGGLGSGQAPPPPSLPLQARAAPARRGITSWR